ncbi:unnamed protein product, partial [Polarella glacialis]
VLSAPDHYSALGAPTPTPGEVALTTGELRRFYLQASVRVHPDKNSHPDSTRAFQRVAAAWAVLGDDQERRRYDAALRSGASNAGAGGVRGGFGEPGGAGRAGSYGPDVSQQDAFAAFACAAAAAAAAATVAGGLGGVGGGVGGAVGNFAEVLFCAQQLASLRESGDVPDAMTAASGGLAFSSGLRAAGAAARA